MGAPLVLKFLSLDLYNRYTYPHASAVLYDTTRNDICNVQPKIDG